MSLKKFGEKISNCFDQSVIVTSHRLSARRHDTQHNDIQQNDIQQNDIQQNNIQHKGIQLDDTRHNHNQHIGSVVTLSVIYAESCTECHICRE